MLKIMQIGYGYWGHNVAKKLNISKEFEFLYLAEMADDKREQAKKDYPDVNVIADYKDALKKVDVVAICTQTEYSYEIAMNALNNGVHVFIEKPLAKNKMLALEIANKAKEQELILHCDHLMVYHPVIRYMKNLIESGEIGDIMYIDISRVNLGPIRKDIDAMLDLAVHDIAVVDYFLDGLEPQCINAIGAGLEGRQDTITYLTMKNNNTLININSSWVSPIKVRKMIVGGTRKMMIFDDLNVSHKLSIYDSGIDVIQGNTYGEYEFLTRVGDVKKPYIKWEDSLQNSLEYFAKCVKEKIDSLSGPEQSLRVMHILDIAQEKLH